MMNPVVQTIKFRFEQKGFEVLTAYDGYQALGAEPDLVILDVILPKQNGYRVSRFIKEGIKTGRLSKNIAVLLLTARRLDDDPEREGTFIDFSQADLMMYKPFDMNELVKNIRKLLQSKDS